MRRYNADRYQQWSALLAVGGISISLTVQSFTERGVNNEP
jgi:hypothetical protein